MIRIRTIQWRDVPAATKLNRQAGWNQVEDDWFRFLSIEPQGCFAADSDGELVGTAVACAFGPVGWLAMVLVASSHRGRGIGSKLTAHAVSWLTRRGVRTIRLDATPLGRPIYEKLNFVPQYEVVRFEGTLAPRKPEGVVRPASPDDLRGLIDLDTHVTRTERSKWLMALFSAWPEAVRVVSSGNEILGFVAARRGARAIQIGPCVATRGTGAILFGDLSQRYAGYPICVDVPLANSAAAHQAAQMGLDVQRHLIRMCRGDRVREKMDQLWASSGPEMG